MIEVSQLEKTFGDVVVLEDVSFRVETGESVVIIGRSGGGKSVLLKHIIGLMQPDAGEVWFQDQNLAGMNEEQLVPLRKETGMLFQNGALFDSLTVGEN